MLDFLRSHQIALLPEEFDNRLIRLEDLHSGEAFHVARKFALMIHRRVNLHAVFQAGVVVVLPMSRRGMHAARALIQRHVIGQDAFRGAINKRMAAFQMLHFCARKFRQHDVILPVETLYQVF